MPDISGTDDLQRKLFGLIGFPLAQSYSKKYFDNKFRQQGLVNCSFRNFPINDINAFLPLVVRPHPELRGIAVTIPYKKQVIPFLDDRSRIPPELDACNCIRVRDGYLSGFNTDAKGFGDSLLSYGITGIKKAIILGTGGAAEAVKYALRELGIPYFLVSRKKGQGISGYQDLDEEVMTEHQLIVNTTPLGMYPDEDSAPAIPYHMLTKDHLLYDLVYNPALTSFMKKGMAKGAAAVNGEKMLEIQAEENWKIWNS